VERKDDIPVTYIPRDVPGAPQSADEESRLLHDWPETARYDMTVEPTAERPNPPIDWVATREAVDG
jgi:hypothetical protein